MLLTAVYIIFSAAAVDLGLARAESESYRLCISTNYEQLHIQAESPYSVRRDGMIQAIKQCANEREAILNVFPDDQRFEVDEIIRSRLRQAITTF